MKRKENLPKITIGVTKLKTKELPMNFDVEQKIIYAELPQELNENDFNIYFLKLLTKIHLFLLQMEEKALII